MAERVYESFSELMDIIVKNYRISRHLLAIGDIVKTMKSIYKDPEIFEYVFERFYSNARNPFTTAYHEFMNFKNSGYHIEDIFYFLAENILTRMLKEYKYNEFTVF
uniref:Uncharacterized protein n=1 Tax=viral metagenome TaxID=1070528 RepID=A0A6C0AY66_9ZZZZ